MKITIHDKSKIFAIQKEFNEMFPYLKAEFYNKPRQAGGYFSHRMMDYPDKTLGECRTIHRAGTIVITPAMTVADLEWNFRDVYGLSIQVFRKSGKIWLETTVTDAWTLEEQNRQGESLSNYSW